MTSPTEKTVRVFIRGLVQGVNYRRWLQKEARARGICGWVRNREDGRVEALLHGEAAAVAALVHSCQRGPLAARVDKVHAEPADCAEMTDFHIESTV